MGVWTVTLIGLVVILGGAGFIIVHFLRQAFDSEDATKIDKLPSHVKSAHADKSRP